MNIENELGKWPYKRVGINDQEQNEMKAQMEECCVAFIDILGFKNLIKNDIDRVILALRDIELFCKSVYRFPMKSDNTYRRESYLDSEELLEYLPSVTMFSDSIVISQKFDDFFDFSEFVSLISALQFELLSKGILIRGGISIGTLFHKDRYIFGDGLISAYYLESSKAIYPRIIIDNSLVERLEKTYDEQYEKYISDYIRYGKNKSYLTPEGIDLLFTIYPFVTRDVDGCYYIDYFKENFIGDLGANREFFEESMRLLTDFWKETMSKIKDYILQGLANADSKDLPKYEWLKKKFNKTLRWGLSSYNNAFHNLDEKEEFYKKWDKAYIKE